MEICSLKYRHKIDYVFVPKFYMKLTSDNKTALIESSSFIFEKYKAFNIASEGFLIDKFPNESFQRTTILRELGSLLIYSQDIPIFIPNFVHALLSFFCFYQRKFLELEFNFLQEDGTIYLQEIALLIDLTIWIIRNNANLAIQILYFFVTLKMVQYAPFWVISGSFTAFIDSLFYFLTNSNLSENQGKKKNRKFIY